MSHFQLQGKLLVVTYKKWFLPFITNQVMRLLLRLEKITSLLWKKSQITLSLRFWGQENEESARLRKISLFWKFHLVVNKLSEDVSYYWWCKQRLWLRFTTVWSRKHIFFVVMRYQTNKNVFLKKWTEHVLCGLGK